MVLLRRTFKRAFAVKEEIELMTKSACSGCTKLYDEFKNGHEYLKKEIPRVLRERKNAQLLSNRK